MGSIPWNITALPNSLSQSCPFYINKSMYTSYNATNFQNFTIPASLFTEYGWRWFFDILACTKFTTSGLIGALKTAGKETVVPNGSFLSLYILIRGRAADSDWNKNSQVRILPLQISKSCKHKMRFVGSLEIPYTIWKRMPWETLVI
jgi:hypothetical protein